MKEHKLTEIERQHFFARGKLLLTGEYAVLDNALAMALPCKKGQTMEVTIYKEHGHLYWTSFNNAGIVWFEGYFDTQNNFEPIHSNDPDVAGMLCKILRSARQQQAYFLEAPFAVSVTTALDFPREWGLGSSSTLISLIAQWSQTDPYRLLADSFTGSGYDIACATAQSPILFQKLSSAPDVQEIVFKPSFRKNIYFVWLQQKQDSRQGIKLWNALPPQSRQHVAADITAITESLLDPDLEEEDFCQLIQSHEEIIGKAIHLLPVKKKLFSDFWGEIKSLGAWGGDFVMVVSEKSTASTEHYFKQYGFNTVISWEEMVL